MEEKKQVKSLKEIAVELVAPWIGKDNYTGKPVLNPFAPVFVNMLYEGLKIEEENIQTEKCKNCQGHKIVGAFCDYDGHACPVCHGSGISLELIDI